MDEKKVFSKDSLSKLVEQNPSNTYISIHENVYDVTPFLDEHPGGEEALKEHTIKPNQFKDATESFEDVGHSMDARDLMKKYQIGVLENKKDKPAPKPQEKVENKQNGGGIPLWLWPVIIAGAAFAIHYFTTRS